MNIVLIKKSIREKLYAHIPYRTISIGSYIRGLYLQKCFNELSPITLTHVLDAGSGDGNYSKWLIEKYPFLKINAYDIEDSLLWKHMPKNITFRKKDLQDLHEKEKYDFCLCIDVLNCIPENKIALHNICQSIKKGGYIYIHIPAKKQKRILFKEYFKQYDVTSRKKFPGQLYSKEELVEIVSSFGLTPIKISSTFGLFGNIAWEINAFTGEKSNIFIKITLIPLLILLSFLECAIHNKEGNGMLLLAKK